MLLFENKKHAERSVAHLYGIVKRKNITAETDYKMEKLTAQQEK
jgi:hypothetical protein